MRKEYDMSDRAASGSGSRAGRSVRILDDDAYAETFTYPQESSARDFDDEFFDVPEAPVTGSRRVSIPPQTERPAARRTRGARSMPKRLSEELEEEQFEEIYEPEVKAPRQRRKYTKQAADAGEQIPLKLKAAKQKPDSAVKQRQVLGVLLVMSAILITLAIISYSPLDTAQAETSVGELPGIFTRANPQVNANADTAHNWLGLVGSMIADFFINQTIGYVSIIFPILFGWWSLALFRFSTKQRRKLTVATSFIIISAVLFTATIGTTQLMNALPHLDREWAGAVGQFLGLTFTRLIGSIGSLIIFATSFLVMLIFSIDLDVERTFLRGKSIYQKFTAVMRMKLIEFWDKREAKRAEKFARKEAAAEREEPEADVNESNIPILAIKQNPAAPIAAPQGLKSVPMEAAPVIAAPMIEAIPPMVEEAVAKVDDVITIRRNGTSTNGKAASDGSLDEKTPYLKVRPAPKTNGAAPMTRISKTDDEMLGAQNGHFARLSGGATGSPLSAKRAMRILPTDFESPADVPTESAPTEVETKTDAQPREVIRLTPAEVKAEEPPIIIGDEKVLSNEALPHSVEDGIPVLDLVKDHKPVKEAVAPTLFPEAKPFIPENPYQEVLNKYKHPPLELLSPPHPDDEVETDNEELTAKGTLLRDKLATFGVEIENITVTPGPVVTLYEFTPAEGVKVSAVGNLTDDIALAMKARGIRIIAPMPGRGTIGIEIPNDNPKMVNMRSVLSNSVFANSKMNLPLALGKTISGDVYVDDLSKMPHLLIAGATGSGKSVGVNGIIASLLYAKSPRDVKFVVVDPKKIELSLYKALRNHFLIISPEAGEEIITTPQYAVLALKALEVEMEKRYDRLAKAAVRSLADYNAKVAQGKLRSTSAEDQHYHLPYIVVIIDELADLMITAGREIEEPICRLAQMARAVGIHLILATQRPSVDVITGVIKANFPARIAYQVATKVDSRTILDSMGAEQLLGNGDMLYLPSGTPKPIRLQSPYISTDEVEAMVEGIACQQGQGMSYTRPWTLPSLKQKGGSGGGSDDGDHDELFDEAAWLVFRHQQASTSMLQRRLKIGYSRAARIVDELERCGIVGGGDGSKGREVLIDNEDEMELVMRNI